MEAALAEAKRQANTTTAQLERNIEELGKSVGRVLKENEALQDELTRARADLTSAANVDRQLRDELDAFRALGGGDARFALANVDDGKAYRALRIELTDARAEVEALKSLHRVCVARSELDAMRAERDAAMAEAEAESKLGTVLAGELAAEKLAHHATMTERDRLRAEVGHE